MNPQILKIQKHVDWNFGYRPTNVYLDDILEERNKLSMLISKNDIEWWKIYEKGEYNDDWKNLMVFMNTDANTN